MDVHLYGEQREHPSRRAGATLRRRSRWAIAACLAVLGALFLLAEGVAYDDRCGRPFGDVPTSGACVDGVGLNGFVAGAAFALAALVVAWPLARRVGPVVVAASLALVVACGGAIGALAIASTPISDECGSMLDQRGPDDSLTVSGAPPTSTCAAARASRRDQMRPHLWAAAGSAALGVALLALGGGWRAVIGGGTAPPLRAT